MQIACRACGKSHPSYREGLECHKKHMSDYEIKTYGIGSVYIEGGMYTKEEIKGYLEYFELMNNRAKELAEELRKAHPEVDDA